jgi:ABC-type microcin C transport system duplicated ATPase subunit YejF
MKLTDTQRALLEAAAKHPQKKLTNFPDTLKGGARIKVLTAMRNAQLLSPAR